MGKLRKGKFVFVPITMFLNREPGPHIITVSRVSIHEVDSQDTLGQSDLSFSTMRLIVFDILFVYYTLSLLYS